jgi:hypothetical protein
MRTLGVGRLSMRSPFLRYNSSGIDAMLSEMIDTADRNAEDENADDSVTISPE